MKNLGRRTLRAIGTGFAWGAVWFGAGLLLARVPGFHSDLPFALLFAPLGFATGVIFSGVLAGVEGRRGFDRTSLPFSAAVGAASGLLLSGVIVAGAALRGSPPVSDEFLTFGPPLAAAGAVCAAGAQVVARRAGRRELG